jgi:AcrR family transcriptional regulator
MQVSTYILKEGKMAQNTLTPRSEQTRARILEAASQLFTEKGYAGTTTRAIAKKAEVNEVTLFRHFGTKEKLAQAIMDQFGGLAIVEDLEGYLSGDYHQDLTLIGGVMMNVMTERADSMRMAICEAGNFPQFREVVAENPRQLRRMLGRYFQRQMRAGLIETGHPEALAQAFLGMFFSYVVLNRFLLDSLDPEISQDEIVVQFVSLFVRGTVMNQE